MPMEMIAARNSFGSALSGEPRSSMIVVQSLVVK